MAPTVRGQGLSVCKQGWRCTHARAQTPLSFSMGELARPDGRCFPAGASLVQPASAHVRMCRWVEVV